jgi:hypothetical protein
MALWAWIIAITAFLSLIAAAVFIMLVIGIVKVTVPGTCPMRRAPPWRP